jgi:Protein of unknown function (DUF 659)/hAT family C-terminal dimerisation region
MSLNSLTSSEHNPDPDPDCGVVVNDVDVDINLDENTGINYSTPSVSTGKKGRDASSMWAIFTKEVLPQQRRSAICQHCNETVSYHQKVARAKGHLINCMEFKKLMNSIDISERPEWYVQESSKKKLNTTTSSGSSSTQTSIRNYALPPLKKAELEKIEENLAMHYYITGTSFYRVEEPHLAKAFNIARKGVVLPGRKKLAGACLENCYAKVKKLTEIELQNTSVMSCLTTDGTTNVKNSAVINYMIVNHEQSLFLESVETGEQSHNAEFIAADLSRMINSCEATGMTIVGAVTDNTSTNKKAWATLKKEYPMKFFHGCASHGLHLIVKDIFAPASIKDGFPFEYLVRFALACKKIVQFFSHHHKEKALLVKQQEQAKLPQLIQPAPTRWGTLLQCITSLRASEKILHQMVNDREFLIHPNTKQIEKRDEIKKIICDALFVHQLTKSIAILTPIQVGITMFQNDHISLSEVYRQFAFTMPGAYQQMDCLSADESTYVLGLIKARLDFMYGEAIGLSYLLDPNYLADGMQEAHKVKALDFLTEYGPSGVAATQENADERQKLKDNIYKEWADWTEDTVIQKGRTGSRLHLLTAKKYWNIDGSKYPALKSLAMRVFGMVSSSAASERGFSTMNFVHSKLRNCLSAEKVKKLIYIKTNAPQLFNKGGSNHMDMDWGASDESGEEKEEEDEENDDGDFQERSTPTVLQY